MNSHINPQFRELYLKLPPEVRRAAREAYKLWLQNPHHPSLHFKPIADNVFSVRIGLHWRALGVKNGEEMTWFWIGSHANYDKKIS